MRTIPISPAHQSFRSAIEQWIESARSKRIIMVLIVINAIVLGLETDASIMASHGNLLHLIDSVILQVFVVEIGLRIFVHRLNFFRDAWSIFDFIVVAVALVPTSGTFSVFRSLRVLRVLRLITMVPAMRRVVEALLSSIPGLSSIALVLMLIYYVFAVIATNLFSASFPHWFGSIGESMFTLFQIMTLESWSMGIVRPLMEVHPEGWVFFITFILITTFTMLNLFIAIIVNAMHRYTEKDKLDTRTVVSKARDHIEADIHSEVSVLSREIAELKQLVKSSMAR